MEGRKNPPKDDAPPHASVVGTRLVIATDSVLDHRIARQHRAPRRRSDRSNWCEGSPLTVLCESSGLLAGPSPSAKSVSNDKRIPPSPVCRQPPSLTTLAGNLRQSGNWV